MKINKIIISIIAATSLYAGNSITTTNVIDAEIKDTSKLTETDKKVIAYQKNIIKNPNYKIHEVTIANKKLLNNNSVNGFYEYNLEISLTQLDVNKQFVAPMSLFTNGKYAAYKLVDMETGLEVGKVDRRTNAEKQREKFEENFVLPNSYYDKDHLLYGSMDAKTKVVIFSDPLCVYCIKNNPPLMNAIKNSNKDISLYYYDFPLSMHPTAKLISKAAIKANGEGIVDVELKIYEANFEKFFNVYTTKSEIVALNAFNKVMKTNYTLKDLNTDALNIRLEQDIQKGINVRVNGTPTILFNGKYKNSRIDLSKFLSK